MAVPYTYFYSGQIRNYISQFMRVFAGLQCQDGVDRDNDGLNDMRTVNLHYGDMERIVANVLYKDNTFQSNTIPIIAAYLVQLELNDEIRKAPHHIENIVRTRESDNTRIANSRLMPVPYKAIMDLSIYASNNSQMFQIMEQILMLFNPDLVIQKSDNIIDWSYLTRVKLVAINNEANNPSGPDERFISQTISFEFDVWLNFPAKEYSGIIKQIELNVKDNTIDVGGIDLETIIIDENSLA